MYLNVVVTSLPTKVVGLMTLIISAKSLMCGKSLANMAFSLGSTSGDAFDKRPLEFCKLQDNFVITEMIH